MVISNMAVDIGYRIWDAGGAFGLCEPRGRSDETGKNVAGNSIDRGWVHIDAVTRYNRKDVYEYTLELERLGLIDIMYEATSDGYRAFRLTKKGYDFFMR
ncbi:MAG: hypothetical protein LUE27_00385 [Clostridia bacterium]|nr:hypothetical protein [Clostridia bacterium]